MKIVSLTILLTANGTNITNISLVVFFVQFFSELFEINRTLTVHVFFVTCVNGSRFFVTDVNGHDVV